MSDGPADAEALIRGAVERAFGRGAVVVSATASRYATSHPVHELVVDVGGGVQRQLVLKWTGHLLPGALAVRPPGSSNPRREPLVYRDLLARAGLTTAECWDSGEDWVLLEKVAGVELYQVGDVETWRAAGAWLGHAHARLSAFAGPEEAGRPWREVILHHDAAHLVDAADRARRALAGSMAAWAGALRRSYPAVVDRLLALPRTVVHGELYASNVLVVEGARRTCPVDWEMAAIGCGLTDLAALVSGGWSDHDRHRIVSGYEEASGPVDPADLLAARLHVAVSWIGWSPGWTPPAGQAHDWLGEAVRLAERLSLT